MYSDAALREALGRYWGYNCFLPLQQRIVRSLLDGRDVCVVMPTGGGKSLCYQLPAALRSDQTAIVISPLIALMQDQAAQLAQIGIPAAVLNSSLKEDQQAAVMRRAAQGEYRLLYLSPERLARPDTIGWLTGVPISFFAIDEAHCISEWGHEFRPDYRQLGSLREHFAGRPIAAFTASATQRVRHDIIAQLQLRDPDRYIASFHRPNLRYVVKQCDGHAQTELLLAALRTDAGSNVIVYAPTIARVEQTVDFLEGQGRPAIAYHGQMDAETRRRNQERWTSDEVPVLVGTIAFGLGINKAAVRTVIHLSLPKSIEQYYQEAGRAGRDGHPADCLLLWRKRDAGLLAHFIDEIQDPEERERAWQRYHLIREFAESKRCRHRQICQHFGEIPKWTSCGACDVCSGEPEWFRTVAMLPQPARPKRTRQSATPAAFAALPEPSLTSPAPQSSRQVSTPSPAVPTQQSQPANADAAWAMDMELREYLREWRRAAAKERGLPAFTVMHDTSLDELCRIRPRSLGELRGIWGFGERKTKQYGPQILEALKRFESGSRASAVPQKSETPTEETIRLLREGRSFEEIARIRGRRVSTVVQMVADLVECGAVELQPGWVDEEKQASIAAAYARHGLDRLPRLKEALPPEITFEEIGLVVASLRRRLAQP